MQLLQPFCTLVLRTGSALSGGVLTSEKNVKHPSSYKEEEVQAGKAMGSKSLKEHEIS